MLSGQYSKITLGSVQTPRQLKYTARLPAPGQEENTKRPKLGQRLGRKPVRRLERSKEVEENQVDITARNRQ